MFYGTKQLRDDVNAILDGMLCTPMVEIFTSAEQSMERHHVHSYKLPPLPSVEPGVGVMYPDGGVLNTYIGMGYMHVHVPIMPGHGPPVPVARALGVKSCKETCATCRKPRGCLLCEDCCVHLDKDHSLSVLLGIQEKDQADDQMAFFVMGNKAFPLSGGRAFLFDGRFVPHGVYCMHGNYTGMAFVKKMPLSSKCRPTTSWSVCS